MFRATIALWDLRFFSSKYYWASCRSKSLASLAVQLRPVFFKVGS